MKNKILVEGKFGHGVRTERFHYLRTKWRRLNRPSIGQSSTPFNWTQPVDNITKVNPNIKNQFQADSCGGEAGSYLIGLLNALVSGLAYIEISAKSIYSRIWYPGGGTTVPALENQLCVSGANLESDVPSYQNATTTETFMEDKTWVIPALLQKALDNSGYTTINVNIDMDSIAHAIAQYGGIIWEIAGQNNGTWLSANPQPPISKLNLWNHFMCVGGAMVYNNQNSLKSLQSWGADVGENGCQYFNEKYINSGYIIDCFTFVKNNSVPVVSYGTSTPDTSKLQKALGMPVNLQTGFYGFMTLCAVVKYEIVNMLSITSTISPKMWTMLTLSN